MTREEAIFCEKSYIGETNCTDCKYYGTETCKSRESHRMAIKALEQEQKTGHWIALGNYDDYGEECSYKCSECGDLDNYSDNYCPNCGAKMVKLQRK